VKPRVVEREVSLVTSTPTPLGRALALVALVLLANVVVIGAETQPGSAAQTSISFSKQVAPILVSKCQTCHNTEKSKGGYRLETFDTLMKAGDSKEAPVVPGNSKQSKLYQLITATDPDDRMPQKADALPVGQVALIEKWISEGAKFDSTNRATPLSVFAAGAVKVQTPQAYPRAVPILALAFNPVTHELAAGGYGEVTIWKDAKLIRRIGQMPQKIQALAFTGDGATLGVGGGSPGMSGEVLLIRGQESGVRRQSSLSPPRGEGSHQSLGTFSDMVLDVKFAPGDKRLACAGADNSIRIYDVESGRQQLVIQQHADWVTGVAFSHDGKLIASSSRDRSCRVFDAASGELEMTYLGHEGPVLGLIFTPDDKSVCSAGRKIHLWSVKEGKKSSELVSGEGEILKLASEGYRLFACSSDKIVREYDLGEKVLRESLAGHADWVYSVAIDPARQRLATGAFDGEVRVWDMKSGELVEHFIAAPGLLTARQ
jgi:WD40 repeat protein